MMSLLYIFYCVISIKNQVALMLTKNDEAIFYNIFIFHTFFYEHQNYSAVISPTTATNWYHYEITKVFLYIIIYPLLQYNIYKLEGK